MSHYQAPLTDMYFNLFDLWQTQKYWDQSPSLREMLDQETASAILEEAAKVAAELIAPQSKLADQQGVQWRADFVREVGGKLRQPLHAVVQPREHAVERLHRFEQFGGGAAGGQTLVEAAQINATHRRA